MAPPTSTTTKGTNPAPDYNLLMNQISMTFGGYTDSLQLLRQHRASAAAISAKTAAKRSASLTTTASNGNDTSASTGSFSSLQKTTLPSRLSKSQTPQEPDTQAAHLAAEAVEFASEHGAAPNQGIGYADPKRSSDQIPGLTGDAAQDKSTQALRARLLGRKGLLAARRGEADAAGAARRKRYGGGGNSSEDDEPGRSGLGREKKKRRRSEAEDEVGEGGMDAERASARESDDSTQIDIPTTESKPSREVLDILGTQKDTDVNIVKTGKPNSMVAELPITVSGDGKKRKKRKKKQKKAKQEKAG